MATSKPFEIETRSFPSELAAKAFFKEMLGRYRVGKRVADEDARDLAALLKHHTEYAEKLGAGIDYFKVRRNDYNTKAFWIYRVDGSDVVFSYLHCITPKKS